MAGVGFCIGVFGSVYVLIGVGILLKWSWVPTAIYIVCGLTIFHRLVVLLQLAGAAAPAVPEARTIEVALSILAIIVAGFQIYIISATRDAY